MLRLKWLFSPVYTTKILISTAFKEVGLSLKKISSDSEKILKIMNLSLELKKQYQLLPSFKLLKFIKLEKTKRLL